MEHDHSYKHLFSHPEMMADLLRGFVREEWVSQVDFNTLERMSGSYVADDLRERHDDLVWRVRWGKEGWLYVYLLLEFQSQVDRFMRRAFTVWLGRVFLSGRMPGVKISRMQDIQEVKSMLAERVKEWTQEWKRQGLEEGRKEGRKEGEAALLLKQIELKFGDQDETIRARISSATSKQLTKWGEKILTASTVKEMFGK